MISTLFSLTLYYALAEYSNHPAKEIPGGNVLLAGSVAGTR